MKNKLEAQKVSRSSIESEKTIRLPETIALQEKLWAVAVSDPQEEKMFVPLLVASLESSGGELLPIGMATVLLSATRKFLTAAYGPEKSMTSLEGLSLMANRLPAYVDALVDDPETAAAVKKEITDAMPHIETLYP